MVLEDTYIRLHSRVSYEIHVPITVGYTRYLPMTLYNRGSYVQKRHLQLCTPLNSMRHLIKVGVVGNSYNLGYSVVGNSYISSSPRG